VPTPDEHTEHDTYEEQPPDAASDHGATYRSGAEDICPIPIGIFEKNSMVYVGHALSYGWPLRKAMARNVVS